MARAVVQGPALVVVIWDVKPGEGRSGTEIRRHDAPNHIPGRLHDPLHRRHRLNHKRQAGSSGQSPRAPVSHRSRGRRWTEGRTAEPLRILLVAHLCLQPKHMYSALVGRHRKEPVVRAEAQASYRSAAGPPPQLKQELSTHGGKHLHDAPVLGGRGHHAPSAVQGQGGQWPLVGQKHVGVGGTPRPWRRGAVVDLNPHRSLRLSRTHEPHRGSRLRQGPQPTRV
mmetsp:Transcript_86458/g.197239  ORF Transcript_86458/g.197239 Transcript_86458/m.197239 type:complete len:225 (+) Transcript_86458:354-1028(+)